MLFGFRDQARVVQRLDIAIHGINHYPAKILVCFVNINFIRWIMIYPVDSVIQPLNNWGQKDVYNISAQSITLCLTIRKSMIHGCFVT